MTASTGTDRIRDAVYDSLTAEFATARDDRPAVVPVTPFFDREREVVVVTAAPAFAGKAERAAANPRVSLLLHEGEGRLHLTGRATVRDDDLEANTAVVERLIRDEPPSPKRKAMVEAADFLGTRLGLLLLDWYGLRILIEIRPTAVDSRPSDGTTTVPTWSAAGVDGGEAETYDRVVATVTDDAGYPRSWPVSSATVRDGRLRLTPPDDVTPVDGQPACVLVHWHDADLAKLEQRLIRGRCRKDARGLVFDPASSFHLRNRTPRDRLRFIVDGKRRTRAYFDDRGRTYRPVPRLRTLLEW
ncbi:pyridoxamine 5'-phosphate oxidase family protein [Haloferax sp. Atlit-4N]|uniref:Hemerythrin HHE cation-binding protein n=1 Tax=Haloferax gibbonsii TaxID=35746 RepID=A0A0K1IZ05_HALGI|nr:hemerythrin HHE cation-binding protein [Haloferax gibbonsii]RDZ50899.1 pyridoxamine 5'-phosphate oxidase family protein [Haloferax sp. Atlit-4N]